MHAQFDPLAELNRLEREFQDVARATRDDRPRTAGPAVDVYERDGTIVAMVELPGVKPCDVRVHVDGDRVTVQGQRSRHTDHLHPQSGRCCRLESSCSFRRTFTLPAKVDPSRSEANLEDGILTLRFVTLGS